MKLIKDSTGRMAWRPYFEADELERECEQIVYSFLARKFGNVPFPVPTHALELLIESEADDLDMYADLSGEGADVEGLTEFRAGQKPRVKISKALSEVGNENRLRTTLTHEFGHVKFHGPLWRQQGEVLDPVRVFKIQSASDAPVDWMEWQAGYVCGAVLMPRSVVLQVSKNYLGIQQYECPLDVGQAVAQGLAQHIAMAFRVSKQAALVRLIKLGLVAGDVDRRSKASRC